ncbi:MAG TPA: Hsp20/alpha crystallin family protein [Candidatus Melainabacteria bacterium]|nr:Hsp20/alpha crystallin family protein [Candidatus Melainabacteria bacterium]HMP52902.1 Hsp20/alpha crystallin family protein [Candidatus Melainabacteria bacterium]
MTDSLITKDKAALRGEVREKFPVVSPAVDIYQSDDEFMLVTEMPGVNESTVEIVLDQGILTIEGKIERPSLDGFKLTHSEVVTGNYRRVFKLSEEVDTEKADAVMKDGILTLRMPKHERAKARKISVRSE